MKRLRGWGGSTLRRLSFYCSGGGGSLILLFHSAWAWPQTSSETCWCLHLTEVGKVATCFDNISSAFSARMWGLPAGRCLCLLSVKLQAKLQARRGRAIYWLWKISRLHGNSHWCKRAEFLEPSPKFPVLRLHMKPAKLAWWRCASCEHTICS